MSKFKFLKVMVFDAVGGSVNADYKRQATPTRSGRYVVGIIEKHRSAGRWPLSTIAWGTPIRLNQNKIQVNENGIWSNLSSLPGYFFGYKNREADLINLLATEYKSYLQNLLTKEELNKKIPDYWMFNDFGHLAIKYFNDINGRNYKRDKGETVLSDFIHTVPVDEYRRAVGISSIQLPESHGCIHLHPKDIDLIIKAYLKIGSVIEIHSYLDTHIPMTMEQSFGRPPYEAHFYPGMRKIVIYQVSKI